jgi:glucose dehydrogenase
MVSFTPRPLFPLGKSPHYQLDRRLGELQSQSGSRGVEKTLLILIGIEFARPYTDYAIPAPNREYKIFIIIIIIIINVIILTANGFLPGDTDTILRHNTQIRHITQNNTPRSNKTQHTKPQKQ